MIDLPPKIVSLPIAYEMAVVESSNGETINLQQLTFWGDLAANGPIAVTLQGGCDCTYTPTAGRSVIAGTLTISDGTLTMENIVLGH